MSLILIVLAIVCFVLYALIGFIVPTDTRLPTILLGVGLAAFAAAFVVGIPVATR